MCLEGREKREGTCTQAACMHVHARPCNTPHYWVQYLLAYDLRKRWGRAGTYMWLAWMCPVLPLPPCAWTHARTNAPLPHTHGCVFVCTCAWVCTGKTAPPIPTPPRLSSQRPLKTPPQIPEWEVKTAAALSEAAELRGLAKSVKAKGKERLQAVGVHNKVLRWGGGRRGRAQGNECPGEGGEQLRHGGRERLQAVGVHSSVPRWEGSGRVQQGAQACVGVGEWACLREWRGRVWKPEQAHMQAHAPLLTPAGSSCWRSTRRCSRCRPPAKGRGRVHRCWAQS